jgi:hypothetical protein
MSDPEKFLARWSRRKRAVVEDAKAAKSSPPAQAPAAEPAGEHDNAIGDAPRAPGGAPVAYEPPFDLTRLPPIESLTAESDIRAFLAPGVPPELTRAALRRAWSADPKIRDFVGLADYDWDYHTPGSMAGFGPLEMTEELRQFASRVVGGGPETSEPAGGSAGASPAARQDATSGSPQTSIESTQPAAVAAQPPTARGDGDVETPPEERVTRQPMAHPATSDDPHIAMQQEADPDEVRTQVARPHGRALPK